MLSRRFLTSDSPSKSMTASQGMGYFGTPEHEIDRTRPHFAKQQNPARSAVLVRELV